MKETKNSIRRLEAVARAKNLRLGCGESAEEYGAFVGVSGSTVHRWENPDSDSNPSARQLLLICQRCDVSPTWLLFGLGASKLSEIAAAEQDAAVAKDGAIIVERIAAAAASLEKIENAIASLELKATTR